MKQLKNITCGSVEIKRFCNRLINGANGKFFSNSSSVFLFLQQCKKACECEDVSFEITKAQSKDRPKIYNSFEGEASFFFRKTLACLSFHVEGSNNPTDTAQLTEEGSVHVSP